MNPQELLNRMDTAIIKTGFLKNTSVYGRPERLALTKDTLITGIDSSGKEIPVYNLKQASGSDDGFLSYICDYEKREFNYQVLGREADFCFTITMNGCTFGVGTPASDGTVVVSHGNQTGVKDEPGVPVGDMYQKQNALAQQFHGDGVRLLEPGVYRPTGRENITTFGVWMNGAWNFFYQSYQNMGNFQFKLLGLSPFKTNLLMGQ